MSREQLAAAVEAVDATTRPEADTHLEDLLARYGLVRRFLPALLATLRLQAAPGGADVLEAWEALRALERAAGRSALKRCRWRWPPARGLLASSVRTAR